MGTLDSGAFELRKMELQREGYDPGRIADPRFGRFVRDDDADAYVALTPERRAAIRAGAGRL